MFKEITSVLLGLFMGLFTSFVGTPAGTSIMVFLLLFLNILPNQTMVAGTLLLIGSIPLGLFGLYEYHKNKSINYYISTMVIIGISAGYLLGSKYSFIVKETLGEKHGDKIKFGITAVSYAFLTIVYTLHTLNA